MIQPSRGCCAKKTDRYTSASMQNEVLQTMALSVVGGISTSIRKVKYFAIITDEVTDALSRCRQLNLDG